MQCPNHERPPVGICPACGRNVCDLCLDDLESPRVFTCPDCGGRGAVLFDLDVGEADDPLSP